MSEHVQIAQTILQQIQTGVVANTRKRISGAHAMVCWGTRNPQAMSRTNDSLGGIVFKVSGAIFQGIVYVKLAFDDTYTIELWDKMMNNTPSKVTQGIYFDQLAEVLDSYIETGH